MGYDHIQEHEVMMLLLEMSSGDASTEQFEQLDDWVRNDPRLRQLVAEGLLQLSDLEWDTRIASSSQFLQADADAVMMESAFTPPALDQAVANHPAQKTGTFRWLANWPSSYWVGLAGSFLVGIATTLWALRPAPETAPIAHQAAPAVKAATPVATLISNSSMMWDTEAGSAIVPGSSILANRQVALFDGAAEVQFGSKLNLRFIGPAVLSASSAGVPEVKYGKALLSNASDVQTRIEVPLASTLVTSGSLVGVDAFGDEVVIHVFEGDAVVVPTDSIIEPFPISVGQSVRLRTDAHSKIAIDSSNADFSTFDFKAAVSTDKLHIHPSYPRLIRDANPVAYWRFEDLDANEIANEMGDSHVLSILGDEVRIVKGNGNNYAEFCLRDSPGGFVDKEPYDSFCNDGYSIEMWMRAGHFHRGVLAALFRQTSDEFGDLERHGLIVETHAAHPAVAAGKEGRPKAIRFLHRSPPHDLLGGVSCFATPGYAPRTWQHVAAVKDGSMLQIYIDGELSATAVDSSLLPDQLTLVIGQLFSFGSVRPFVGDLDEIAFYDRALTEEEVQSHVAAAQSTRTLNNQANAIDPMVEIEALTQ